MAFEIIKLTYLLNIRRSSTVSQVSRHRLVYTHCELSQRSRSR